MDSIWSSPQALSLLVQQSTQRFELLRWPLKNFKKPFSFTPCSPQASRGMVMRLGACPSGKGSSWYVMKRRRVVLFLPESFLCVCKLLNYFLGPNCIWFSGEHSTESNQSPQSWSMGCIYSSEANYCRGLSSCVIADPWTTRHWILLRLLSRFQYRTNLDTWLQRLSMFFIARCFAKQEDCSASPPRAAASPPVVVLAVESTSCRLSVRISRSWSSPTVWVLCWHEAPPSCYCGIIEDLLLVCRGSLTTATLGTSMHRHDYLSAFSQHNLIASVAVSSLPPSPTPTTVGCIGIFFLAVLLCTATIIEAFSASPFRRWHKVGAFYPVCPVQATLACALVHDAFPGMANLQHASSTVVRQHHPRHQLLPHRLPRLCHRLCLWCPTFVPQWPWHLLARCGPSRMLRPLVFFGNLNSSIDHSYSTHSTSTMAPRPRTWLPRHYRHKGLSSTWAPFGFLL